MSTETETTKEVAKESQPKRFRWNRLIRTDIQGILLVLGIWVFIGSVNIFSATFVEATAEGTMLGSFFIKHLGSLLVSVVLGMAVAYKTDYRWLKHDRLLYAVIGITMFFMIIVPLVGTVVNGARRWIMLGPVSLQPSEFAKLVGVIWAARCCEQYRERHRYVSLWEWYEKGKTRFPCLSKGLIPAFVFALLTMRQPDMATATLIVLFSLAIYLLVGFHPKMRKPLIGAFLGIVALAVILVVLEPYRFSRIMAWYDPWEYAQSQGYQTVQGLLAVGSGGILGVGLTNGTSKYFYLPEAHTDFAFAVWSQETGLIGSLVLIILIVIFTLYGFRIAQRARDMLGTLLAMGITCIISFQAIFNIGMVCGLLPVIGIPLPFVSYGGSSLLMNFLAVGLLLNISRISEANRVSVGRRGPIPSLREETQSRFRPRG